MIIFEALREVLKDTIKTTIEILIGMVILGWFTGIIIGLPLFWLPGILFDDMSNHDVYIVSLTSLLGIIIYFSPIIITHNIEKYNEIKAKKGREEESWK